MYVLHIYLTLVLKPSVSVTGVEGNWELEEGEWTVLYSYLIFCTKHEGLKAESLVQSFCSWEICQTHFQAVSFRCAAFGPTVSLRSVCCLGPFSVPDGEVSSQRPSRVALAPWSQASLLRGAHPGGRLFFTRRLFLMITGLCAKPAFWFVRL